MNLFKRLMPLMAAMAIAFSASAVVQYVVVNDSQDHKTVFALADEPTVTFTATDLVVAAGDQRVSIPLAEMVTFTFSEDVTAIEEILAQPDNVSLSWKGEMVEIVGLKPLSKVALYQTDGKMLNTTTCDDEGRVSLDVESYHGVIIISTQAKAFKIAK